MVPFTVHTKVFKFTGVCGAIAFVILKAEPKGLILRSRWWGFGHGYCLKAKLRNWGLPGNIPGLFQPPKLLIIHTEGHIAM